MRLTSGGGRVTAGSGAQQWRDSESTVWRGWLPAALFLLLLPAAAANAPLNLDEARGHIESVEAAVVHDGLRDRELEQLKARLDPLREALVGRITELLPRLEEIGARLKELGKKPDAEAPPEDAKVTAEREELEKRRATLDGELKQARLLALRIDQGGDRITERRRALFAAEVFTRSEGIFQPRFWTRAIRALPGEWRSLSAFGTELVEWVETRGGSEALLPAALAIGFLGFVGFVVRRWMIRRPAGSALGADAPELAQALAAWRILICGVVPPTLATAILLAVLESNDLLPPRFIELGQSILVAVGIAALAQATGRAALAPDRDARRMLDFDAARAAHIQLLAVWSSRAFAATIVLNALYKVLFAPLSLTLATSAAMSLVVLALIAMTLWTTRPDAVESEGTEYDEPEDAATRWQRALRLFGWVVIAICGLALAIGYVGFASFLIGRLIVAAVLLGVTYLAIVLIDALTQDVLTSSTVRGRGAAAMLGISAGTLEVTGTLLSGVFKVLLFVAVVVVAFGPWGVHVVDAASTFSGPLGGLQFSALIGPLTAAVAALALLVMALVATRLVQSWLSRSLLPRTRLEPSMQSSVAQIVGYLGVIVAALLALGQLGINLQNIALVAGALSVGIGFGLQSIVSNFVSGLILLTERPIRVGDTISVKGEEGYVRRISVRATEIETFERSSVIIPNSDLITGMVKNWTHGNPTGRVIIAINIPYDADPDDVRDILLAAANEHPKVLKVPPPSVFLLKFADNALQFELRCVVTNVDYSLTVRSDLHFSILYRLRKAGVVLPVVPPLPELVKRPAPPNPAES